MAHSTYLQQIWQARYFWSHLAWSDLRFKYRRSVLGLTWAVLHPIALTLLFAFVMSHLFHAAIDEYATFIYSGFIFWEFIVSSAVIGCIAFIHAEPYIKQFNHPLLIYSLRCVLAAMINLLCAFSGLIVWSLIVKPMNFGFAWTSLLVSFPLLFLFSWALATITAFIGVKFRDFSQLITLLLQALYFISPILFLPRLFAASGLGALITYNPIYYLLQLFRAPLLEGRFPATQDYLFVLITTVLLWGIAFVFVKRDEYKVIFYL